MLIFLVPTHSLTMNRNMIEISTRIFKADLPLKQMPRVWKLILGGITLAWTQKALKKEPKKTKPQGFQRRWVKVSLPQPAPLPSPHPRVPSSRKGLRCAILRRTSLSVAGTNGLGARPALGSSKHLLKEWPTGHAGLDSSIFLLPYSNRDSGKQG